MASRKSPIDKKAAKDAKRNAKAGAPTPRKLEQQDTPSSARVVSSEIKRTPVPSATTPAGITSEATARAAAAASPVRLTHEEIARRAYELWCAEGRPEGRQHDHWLAAERSLIVEMKPRATSPARR